MIKLTKQFCAFGQGIWVAMKTIQTYYDSSIESSKTSVGMEQIGDYSETNGNKKC